LDGSVSGRNLALNVAQIYYAVPDVPATCAVLTDFEAQVDRLANRKKPMLSEMVASELGTDAQDIMESIGCY